MNRLFTIVAFVMMIALRSLNVNAQEIAVPVSVQDTIVAVEAPAEVCVTPVAHAAVYDAVQEQPMQVATEEQSIMEKLVSFCLEQDRKSVV